MKVENLVPEVYYKESRDFAFVARCFELIFNYMKSSAQCVDVNYLTEASDSSVIELLADTIGFTAKHRYDNKNLLAIIGSFQHLLRNKGSIYAVELAIRILMTAQGLYDKSNIGSICEIASESEIVKDTDKWKLIIYLPEQLSDIVLLEDLFDYILPAGMIYEIRKYSEGSGRLESEIPFTDSLDMYKDKDLDKYNSLVINNSDDAAEKSSLNIGQIYKKDNDSE